MSASVTNLRAGLAFRYARLMTIGVRPEQRTEAIEQYMDFAERLVEAGFSRDDFERMKSTRRENLILELSEINSI